MAGKTFEELCKAQRNKITEIQNTKVVTGGKVTRRSEELIKKKIEELEKLWATFLETEELIKNHADYKEDHEYVVAKCSEKAKMWYDNVKSALTLALVGTDEESEKLQAEGSDKTPQPTILGTFRMQEEISRVIKLMEQKIAEKSLENFTKTALKQRLSTLENHWENFNQIHFNLVH